MFAGGTYGRIDPGIDSAISGHCYSANEASLSEAIRVGNIIGANDGNLATTPMGLSQTLMDFVTGVTDPEDLDSVLERIAPSAPTGSIMFKYLQEDETAQFQQRSLQQIARPTGGEFPVAATVVGTEANGSTQNLGLVSYLDINQGGLEPIIQQNEVNRLRGIIRRSQIADALAKLLAAANDGGSINWGASTSDPDSDVDTLVDAAGNARGVDANTYVFGQGARLKRRKAYRQPARLNGATLAALTDAELAEQYGGGRFVNLTERYRSSNQALTRQLDSEVLVYWSKSGLSLKDSSNIKRFTYVAAGGGIRVWVEVGTHRVKITVDVQEVTQITNTVGIQKLAVIYS